MELDHHEYAKINTGQVTMRVGGATPGGGDGVPDEVPATEPAIERSFLATLMRPYLDLGLGAGMPLHAHGVVHALHLVEDETLPPIWGQRVLPPSFRNELVEATGLAEHRVRAPADLPEPLRSSGWRLLCERIGDWEDLAPESRIRTAKLLSKLGFNRLILDLIPATTPERVAASPDDARLAYVRACARYILLLGYDARRGPRPSYSPDDLIAVATAAQPSVTRFAAAMKLVVALGKMSAPAESIRPFGQLAERTLHEISPELDDFQRTLLRSGFHRGFAFYALRNRDFAEVAGQMARAEELARSLPRDTPLRAFLTDENLHPVLESRAKEATMGGDLDLARSRLEENVRLDPLDSKPHLELGELATKRGDLEAAQEHFCSAAALGPPSTAIAFYLRGRCLEELNRPENALACYLDAARVDPYGIAAISRALEAAKRLGRTEIVSWTTDRLARLSA